MMLGWKGMNQNYTNVQKPEPVRPAGHPQIPHYYGDAVRVIFVIGAVFILWGLPTMTELLRMPIAVSIIGIAALGIAAGITNPAQRFSLRLNAALSVIFLVAFTYMAWYAHAQGLGGTIEFANQIGAVLFLVAAYFSVKSLRGSMVPERTS